LHLILGCVYGREVWCRVLRTPFLHALVPGQEDCFMDRWLCNLKLVQKEMRRGFNSMVVLVAWMIWKERNDRVFNSSIRHAAQLSTWIREEGRQWVLVGYSSQMELVH
jgi:hypothetical protein